MKTKLFELIFTVSAIVFAVYSASKTDAFSPAEDFPRDALVYVQTADLPEFIKLWRESNFSENYLQSANYAEFSNSHLGLKLASRLKEFEAAAGFAIDLETVAALADKRAAAAIYDIGKIEFVFVAPVSEQLFAATKFMQNSAGFEEEILEEGTKIYRKYVEADRGRQKQELIFCRTKDRFVLATSEKLVVQTIANINNLKTKNALADNPDFKILTTGTKPRTATIWVNQSALNVDFYFKKYQMFADEKKLQNIRAGMFDLSIEAEKIIEHRRFLLNKKAVSAPIDSTRADALLSFLPEDVPFFRLQKTTPNLTKTIIENTLFERPESDANQNEKKIYSNFSFDDFDNSGENFYQTIDDFDEDEVSESETEDIDLGIFFQAADAREVLTFTEPKVLSAPLFIEFENAAIFTLNLPGNFPRQSFESAVSRKLLAQTAISASENPFIWSEKNENGVSRRELELPLLGINVSYAIVGNTLVLTNDAEFLRLIINSRKIEKREEPAESFAKLTVINLDQKDKAYNQIFAELENEKSAETFFTENIESFLSSISSVKQIEIKENFRGIFLEQTIIGHKADALGE